jgi:hypothetical protein
MNGDFSDYRARLEAKAAEKTAVQEYFQTHGVRPANMAELELLEAERRRVRTVNVQATRIAPRPSGKRVNSRKMRASGVSKSPETYSSLRSVPSERGSLRPKSNRRRSVLRRLKRRRINRLKNGVLKGSRSNGATSFSAKEAEPPVRSGSGGSEFGSGARVLTPASAQGRAVRRQVAVFALGQPALDPGQQWRMGNQGRWWRCAAVRRMAH